MTTSPESKTPSAAVPSKRKHRRWVWVMAGVLLLLLIIIVLLPTFLSWGIARRIAVAKANDQINGKVQIDHVSLGWFSGFKLSGISVDDAEGARVAEVKSVSMPASVPALLGGTKRLGETVVMSPVMNVVVYPGGETNLQRLMKPSEKEPTVWPMELGFDVKGSLRVSDGRISVRAVSEEEGLEVRDFKLTVVSEGLSSPVTIEGTGVVGSGGSLKIDGSVTPAQEGKIDPSAIAGNVTFSMDGFDLRGISGIARELGAPVALAGMSGINAELTINGIADVKGSMGFKAPELVASGGPLGEQEIRTPVDLTAQFDKSGDEANFKGNFESALARGDASGTLTLSGSGLPKGNAQARFEVDLAALGRQPASVAVLGEGVQIEDGKVTGSAELKTEGDYPQVTLNAQIVDVKALRDGEEISLEPIRFALVAADTAAGPRVENLEFASSFATARGAGDLQKFMFSLDADLTAGTREAAQFLNLGGRAADGRFQVEATVTGDGGNARQVDSKFVLTDFVLKGITAGPVMVPEATGTLTANANLDETLGLKDLTDLKAVVTSPVFGASFTAARLAPQKGGALPVIENGRMTLNADLANVGMFARTAGLLAADMLMKGQAAVNVGVGVAEGAVQLKPIEVSCTNVDLASGEKHFRQQEFTLSAAAAVDPAKRSMQIENAKAEFSFGQVAIPSAAVNDWALLPAGVTCDITGAVSLGELFAAASDFAPLPEGTSVGGQAELELRVAGQEAMNVTFAAVVDGLTVSSPNVPAMEPQKVALNVDAEANPDKQTASLKKIEMQSRFLNVSATGTYNDWSNQRILKAQGTLEPDWGQIAPLAAALTGQPIQMSGKKAGPFSIEASLQELTLPALLRNATAKADMSIDRVEFMGVQASDIKTPLNLADGRASLLLEAVVSGGRLTLPLRADATTEPPTVYVQDDTPVLQNVKITEPMTDQALAKINPIFQNAVATSGTVGFKLNTFSIPLAEQGPDLDNLEFKAQLSLNQAVLQSTGFLAQALSLAKMNRDDLVTLPDQTIVIELREGRFVQEPISFTAGGYTLTLGGSVGLDKSLDMALAIPLTSGMVPDKNIYELLKDETLTVPVRGTINAPQFGGDILRENLNRLMKSAATKLLQKEGGRLLEDLLK